MKNLLSLKFWFNLRPEPTTSITQKYFLFFMGLQILIYLIFLLIKRKYPKSLYRKIFSNFSSLFLTSIIIGAFLLFFTYEGVPFLSARFWFLVWFTAIAVWLSFIVRNFLKIPKIKEQLKAEKQYRQYIP